MVVIERENRENKEIFPCRIVDVGWPASYRNEGEPSGDTAFSGVSPNGRRRIFGVSDGVNPVAGIPAGYQGSQSLDSYASQTEASLLTSSPHSPLNFADWGGYVYKFLWQRNLNQGFVDSCTQVGIALEIGTIEKYPWATSAFGVADSKEDSLIIGGNGDCLTTVLFETPTGLTLSYFCPAFFDLKMGRSFVLAADELKRRLRAKSVLKSDDRSMAVWDEFFRSTYVVKRLFEHGDLGTRNLVNLLNTNFFPFNFHYMEIGGRSFIPLSQVAAIAFDTDGVIPPWLMSVIVRGNFSNETKKRLADYGRNLFEKPEETARSVKGQFGAKFDDGTRKVVYLREEVDFSRPMSVDMYDVEAWQLPHEDLCLNLCLYNFIRQMIREAKTSGSDNLALSSDTLALLDQELRVVSGYLTSHLDLEKIVHLLMSLDLEHADRFFS